MGALFYLEWRYAMHQLAAIFRSPLRLVLWIAYVGSFGYFIYARSAFHGHGSMAIGAGFAGMGAGTIAGFYVGALGVTIARAAGGRIFAFRNSAEAILFSNAGIRPLTIALWLQVRKVVSSGGRWMTGGLYFFFIFAPHNAGLLANARVFAIVVLAIALEVSVDLPTFLLARGRLRRAIQIFGWGLAVASFAFAGSTFGGPDAATTPLAAFLRFPGVAVAALMAGNLFAVSAIVALLAASIVTVALLGDDALPELYAASVRTLTSRTRRNRGRETRVRFELGDRGPVRNVPPGALALVWKDWVGFKRGYGNLWLLSAECILSAAFGAGVAVKSRLSDDPSLLLSVALMAAIALLLFAPFRASLDLANDLAKPLFWIS
ncbi:MAG: hypothetical protein IAI50_02380, partial [Candidatus Eremiobacteraeota bacterium]|nr:hypothetical protein [Candidatus Eremiobacteraeota bacterium]